MKKLLPLLFVLSGCATLNPNGAKMDALQTQMHDYQNQVNEFMTENKAHNSFRDKCETVSMTFGVDSFAFIKKCPNEARELRKELIKDAYHLTK